MLGQKTQVKSQVLGAKNAGRIAGAWCLVLGRKKQVESQGNRRCLVLGAWSNRRGTQVETQVPGAWCLVTKDQGPRTKDQGLRTKDQALTTFICQVADKATDALMCFCGLVVDTGEFVIVDVFLIQCCVELTFDFCA